MQYETALLLADVSKIYEQWIFVQLIYNVGRRDIFDPTKNYKMLIQQRAHHKITFPGIWSNACCSHPLVNDDNILNSMRRKLNQELGISSNGIIADKDFQFIGKMKYAALSSSNSSWGEHELDHLYIIVKDNIYLNPNEDEVANIRWVDSSELLAEIKENPNSFTPWFRKCIKDILLKNSIWSHIADHNRTKLAPISVSYSDPLV